MKMNPRLYKEKLKEEIKINLKKVENGEALTVPLSVLNGEFKKRYFKRVKFVPKVLICEICGKKFKQKYYNQLICSKKCSLIKSETYREKNKDKIAEQKKAYYERKSKENLKENQEIRK